MVLTYACRTAGTSRDQGDGGDETKFHAYYTGGRDERMEFHRFQSQSGTVIHIGYLGGWRDSASMRVFVTRPSSQIKSAAKT